MKRETLVLLRSCLLISFVFSMEVTINELRFNMGAKELLFSVAVSPFSLSTLCLGFHPCFDLLVRLPFWFPSWSRGAIKPPVDVRDPNLRDGSRRF